jgi:subtilisin family serine protease
MRRVLLCGGFVFALAFAPLALSAQEQVETTAAESNRLWFVELSNPPLADGGSVAALKSEKQAFRNAARAAGLNYKERFAFDTLWNGFSLEIDARDLARVAQLPGVKAIYAVETISLPEPPPDNELNLGTATDTTGASFAHDVLGVTGAGVRVGVIDTGLDYHHPDLGGCFGPGCRVFTGFDFVGDAFNSSGTTPAELTPVPDPDPDDCNGHGSHVSGIVGASGAIRGVAPGVTFGAYRVFGCVGTTSGDIMIAAMERALADGMHIVNMSIGSSRQWPQFPTAAAATRLVNAGVVVVASAGNDANIGLYGSSAPAVGEKVISVASFDNTFTNRRAFRVTPDDMHIAYDTSTGSPLAPATGTFPMARTGTATSTADACSPLPAGSLAGRVALIRRGTCSFYVKSSNAQNAGAVGVVLYNNVAGFFIPLVTPPTSMDPPLAIPVVATSDTLGVLINNRLAMGPVDMTWTDDVDGVTPIANGERISSFSSHGISPDLSLKPDIGAPGGTILSTVPIEQGGYRRISGTSMSSPHTAGAAALVKSHDPNTPSQAMRGILQNSAVPKIWSGNPTLGFLEPVSRQGAGMVNIPGALLATTRIEPGKLSLGESAGGPVTRTLTLENKASTDVTYDLVHHAALANGPSTFAPLTFFDAPASVTFSSASVTVPAWGSATVDVTIEPNVGLPDRTMFGGFIEFAPQGGGQSYRVPFVGFKGDYQGFPILTPTTNGFPWLAQLVGSTFFNRPMGQTYTMVGNDVPFILYHLDHHVRRIRFEVFDAMSGKAWHRAAEGEYFPRNTGANSFFSLGWNGMTAAGKKTYTVPNGQYVIVLTIEKALSDGVSPSHFESWTSPVITIARP